jgi:hypothetical protein
MQSSSLAPKTACMHSNMAPLVCCPVTYLGSNSDARVLALEVQVVTVVVTLVTRACQEQQQQQQAEVLCASSA